MLAVLFPGQGSQYVGMGSDLYQKYDEIKKNFEIVDKALKYSLSEIIKLSVKLSFDKLISDLSNKLMPAIFSCSNRLNSSESKPFPLQRMIVIILKKLYYI